MKELHKPARKNYQRRHVDIRGIDETWQADLVEMQPYEKENKGYKYILTIIDSSIAMRVLEHLRSSACHRQMAPLPPSVNYRSLFYQQSVM